MQGKNILIAGASKGIGASVAEHLSSIGANVILVARNKEKLEQVQNKLANKSYICPYDLQDLEHIEEIFEFCSENQLKLDGFVYCAGINRDIAIRSNDIATMQEVFTVNYMAFVEMLKYYSKKKYSTDGSSIVAISSIATIAISAGMNTYTSSKAALEMAVRIASLELLKRRIRVNAIQPAFVDTDMVNDSATVDINHVNSLQTLGLIDPKYLAYLIEFLLSDKAKYMSGALIPVTAGIKI